MSKSKQRIDPDQLSIFDLIAKAEAERRETEPVTRAGLYDVDRRVRALISDSLKDSRRSRHEVAARMSEYTGQDITKARLDSWTAESKELHRFPLAYLPAFRWACEDTRVIRELATLCEGYYIESEDALKMELGKIVDMEKELTQKKKAITGYLDQLKRRP